MARIYTRTMANYFQKNNINTWRYVKRGLNCWTKSTSDFECKVECPYNERKTECDCHTQVCKDAIEYINELEATLADVVPKSEVDEIIGAFDTLLYKHYNGDISDCDLYKLFAKLKKKYTEGTNHGLDQSVL
ncbi:MAG: hypothetical protein J6S14_12830 [Clostridia bacterium]|nr:hypothetical protein [Clostridia bacterium]